MAQSHGYRALGFTGFRVIEDREETINRAICARTHTQTPKHTHTHRAKGGFEVTAAGEVSHYDSGYNTSTHTVCAKLL